MIAGLDVGADDYIMKPYSLKAVLARVRAASGHISLSKSARVKTCPRLESSLNRISNSFFGILTSKPSTIHVLFLRYGLMRLWCSTGLWM